MIAASSTVIDDVANYVKHRIFNTNMYYYRASAILHSDLVTNIYVTLNF